MSNNLINRFDNQPCDDEVFDSLLRKIKAFTNKLKDKKMEKTDFIVEWEIFNEFFKLMEKYQKQLTDKHLLVLKQGLTLFIHETDDTEPDNVDPDHLLRTDLDYSKKLFYMFFSLFHSDVIQNYLKNIEISDVLKSLYRSCICRILLIMAYTCKISDLGLNDLHRSTYCLEILSSMVNYVYTNFKSLDFIESTNEIMINRCVLSFLLWYSDKTILIPDLMKIDCPTIMVDILTRICQTPKIHNELRLFVVVIIYNISRHDDGVQQLNNLKTSEVIETFQSTNDDIKTDIACYTVLVLLATPEQIKNNKKRLTHILDKLLEKVYDASISPDHRAGNELHLSELLIVFVKLFNDDHALEYIMEQSKVDLHTSSAIEFFINQLLYQYFEITDEEPLKQATCTALVNILWSVSFQEKYKQKLKDADIRFKQLIENLTKQTNQKSSPNQYVPQYIENIQKAAAGLLYNIDELVHSTDETSTAVEKSEKPLIMISYSHKDSEFCKQLHDEISKRGIDIWIDFKFLKTGDLWEQIAAGMKRARVIVCLMSEDYCKSKSCRWEATYALEKLQATKSIIPVFLRTYELPDWLEIRTSTLKYVLFNDLKPMNNDKLTELIDMIEYSLSLNALQQDLKSNSLPPSTHTELPTIQLTNVHSQSSSSNKESILLMKSDKNQDISLKNDSGLGERTNESLHAEKPIEQWNQDDICRWFEENQILIELRDLCAFQDGSELIDYAEIFRETKVLQFQLYSNEFLNRQRPLLLHEFTKFSNALRKLKYHK